MLKVQVITGEVKLAVHQGRIGLMFPGSQIEHNRDCTCQLVKQELSLTQSNDPILTVL